MLGIDVTDDAGAIRKAYAIRLKAMDVDADPAAYANLRAARDMALQEIKHRATRLAQDVSPEFDDAHNHDPDLRDTDGNVVLAAADVTGACGLHPEDASAPVAVPPESSQVNTPTEGEIAGQHLVALLDPPDGEEAVPLDDAELAQALADLRVIIDEAHASPLGRQEAMESWLAEQLARSWPRSAPLLEEAHQAFGWERDWGTVRQRPTNAFLADRLRGLRFQKKVLDPRHVHHKAWKELHRTGRRGFFDRVRVSRRAVRELLDGVRKHFPELESHFDEQRVASYDAAATRPLGFRLPWVFALILAVQVLRVCSTPESPQSYADLPSSPSYDLAGKGPQGLLLTKAVKEAFGEEKTLDWLRGRNEELVETFAANLPAHASNPSAQAQFVDLVVNRVRERVLRATRDADPELVLEAARVRLAAYQAVRGRPASDCDTVMRFGRLPPGATLPEKNRTMERRLASRMVEQGRLGVPQRRNATSAMIPGVVVGKVIELTKYPKDIVFGVFSGKGSEAERCSVNRALLRTTLGGAGLTRDQQLAILRTI